MNPITNSTIKHAGGPHPKALVDNDIYTEIFLELAYETKDDDNYFAPYETELLIKNGKIYEKRKKSKYSSKAEAAKHLHIGRSTKELKDRIDKWNRRPHELIKPNLSSYSRKVNALLSYVVYEPKKDKIHKLHLIKKVDCQPLHKQYRYMLDKRGVLHKLLSMISLSHGSPNLGIKIKLCLECLVNNNPPEDCDNAFTLFDKFIWDDFLSFLMEIFRYRKDYLNNKSIPKVIQIKDEVLRKSTIMDLFEHYIFYRVFGGKHNTRLNEDLRNNSYYRDFQSCCWQYIIQKRFNRYLLPGNLEQPDFLINFYQKELQESIDVDG